MDVRRYTDLMSDTYLVKLLDVAANFPPIVLIFRVFYRIFQPLQARTNAVPIVSIEKGVSAQFTENPLAQRKTLVDGSPGTINLPNIKPAPTGPLSASLLACPVLRLSAHWR